MAPLSRPWLTAYIWVVFLFCHLNGAANGFTEKELAGPSVGDRCVGHHCPGRNMTCSEERRCECKPGFLPIDFPRMSPPKTFCFAPVGIGEECLSDDLCLEENSKCLQAQHAAYCGCIPEHQKILDKSSGSLKCVPETALLNSDLATFIGVGVGMTLFCGLTCLVLRIFARARFGPRRHHYANAHMAPPITLSTEQGEGGGLNSRHSSQRSSTGGGSRRPSMLAPPSRSGYDSRRASNTSIRSAASARSNSFKKHHHRPSDPETHTHHLNPNKIPDHSSSANVSPNIHNHKGGSSPGRGYRSHSTSALAPSPQHHH